ncbi:hypothetical protein BSNK01_07260 [Bacillaceae bacterium]
MLNDKWEMAKKRLEHFWENARKVADYGGNEAAGDRIAVEIDRETFEKIKRIAITRKESISETIEHLLQRYLHEQMAEEPKISLEQRDKNPLFLLEGIVMKEETTNGRGTEVTGE